MEFPFFQLNWSFSGDVFFNYFLAAGNLFVKTFDANIDNFI